MGNVEMDSNGTRDMKEPVTMRRLHRQVHRYRVNNTNIMKDQEKILQILNMLQKKSKKDSGTKSEASARQVETSKYHGRRDGHGNDRQE